MAFAVQIIQQIVQNGQPVALQEAVVVARDIFRRFPNKYEKLVKDLVEKVAEYSEPDARASIAWIIGEHADKITECQKIFEEYFIQSFLEEPNTVKLQILTAAVKIFLKLPDEAEEMIQNILTLATEQVSNPDIKDRAYIYWRMLSTSPQKTQDVVLGKKPNVASDTYNIYDEEFVDRLITGIGGLSSIYHKTPGEWNKEQSKYTKKDEALPPVEKIEEVKKGDKKAAKPKKVVKKQESTDSEEE